MYKILVIIVFPLVFLFSGCNYKTPKDSVNEKSKDSLSMWLDKSKAAAFSSLERKTYLRKAYDNVLLFPEDTVKSKALNTIAYQALKLKDTTLFKKSTKDAFRLSTQLKHNFSIADAHWNYAFFQLDKEVYDSVYYHYDKAHYYFNSINHQYYTAKMLYNMAVIKGKFGDYTGSEALIVQAISKYKSLKKNKSLYESYNHLAVLCKGLKEYDRALFYHKKALGYLNNVRNKKTFYEGSLNNIGLVHKELKKFDRAIRYFDRAIDNDSLKVKNIRLYGRLIDNRAYCKLLNQDTTNVKKEFYEALDIRDSLDHKAGIIVSKIHLAEYYLWLNDTTKAIHLAKEAKNLGKEIGSNQDYLVSLKLLSKIDKLNSGKYLNTYISFNDSLQDNERKIRNKFVRIAYETDEYIAEAKRLSQQKIRISVLGFCVLLLITLLYFIKTQRSKNEKLLFEAEQQRANEQIYILSLKEHTKLEEGRLRERNRISEELHDGILGKLFGTRFGLGFLELNGDEVVLNKFQLFLEELQEIEKEIRTISHGLKHNFIISKTNFETLINDFLKSISEIGGFTYQLEMSERIVWDEVDEIIKVNLYRVLQEALQNIIKYSGAKNVKLDFSFKKKQIALTIMDNGSGFDVHKKGKGIGIKNMESRVQKLNGVFKIHSKINKGTIIYITIPVLS